MTTDSPPVNSALCTCAIEAEPSGVSEIEEKISFHGQPYAYSITSLTSLNPIGVTSERRRINSSQYLFGKMSECNDII